MFTAIIINTRFGYSYYAKDTKADKIIEFIKDLEKKTIINVLEGDLENEFNNLSLRNVVKIVRSY